ncbi:glycoside hydrolase family 3 C-terminal domain-containing protein [Actinoplanes missouriensis]|uniref:glycoside hydrolase family 3 C-terminal domain-containing protein n=1 Tax=Actinoplanes missouriensis TaxID=1866 RepID=UPI0033E8DD54
MTESPTDHEPAAALCEAAPGKSEPAPAFPETAPRKSEPAPAFRDPQHKVAVRVTDLLDRLTLDEKIALLNQHQAAVPRLGVAAFRTGTEALHGVAWLGVATAFPQAIGLASSWNPDLMRRVGEAVGTEVRAMHHRDPENVGLNVWAPVVNLLRDPRWGRNEEGYAEDPWLTGVLSTAYSRGLRGDHPLWLRTAPTLKHFLGYNNETDRCLTSSGLPPRVLHEYELPAFRPALADGAAVAVMASYNLVNGRPAHLSPLIDETLRSWAEEDVLVVGDAWAVHNLAGDQHWYDDHVDGFAAALRAGIDCVTEDVTATRERFTAAYDRGLITESHVDAAVRHILSIRVRLGEFDAASDPYRHIGPEVIDCGEHRELAHEAARASAVLLSNDGILPLDPQAAGRVAVIGPLADQVFEDWYSGTPPYRTTLRAGVTRRIGADAMLFAEGVDRVALRCASGLLWASASHHLGVRGTEAPDIPEEALFDVLDWGEETISLRAVSTGGFVGSDADLLVTDRPGPNGWEVRESLRFIPVPQGMVLHHLQSDRFLVAGDDGLIRTAATSAADATVFTVDLLVDGVAAAAEVAAEADVVLLALGNHPLVAGRETADRRDLDLPGTQDDLMRAVRAVNPRTVLVLTSSYPYAVGWARQHLPALLWSAHGGQEHGAALADILFGIAEPSGRLTQTWYAHDGDLPDLLDYDIIASDATYLYYRGEPLFPFGHGLGYTSFRYENLRLETPAIDRAGAVTVSVDVVNAGDRPGDEVVQLYTRQQRSRVKQPLRRLRGFQRIHLSPGERSTVHFALNAADLAFWDVTRSRWVIEDATHTIAAGRSSADWRQTTTLRVHGERIPARSPDLIMTANDGYALTSTVPIPGTAAGEALRSSAPGAWAVFDDVDFGRGLTRAVATVAGAAESTITIRLDDPLSGPVLAVLPVPVAAGADPLIEVSAQIPRCTGRHDVFVQFTEGGTTVARLQFG